MFRHEREGNVPRLFLLQDEVMTEGSLRVSNFLQVKLNLELGKPLPYNLPGDLHGKGSTALVKAEIVVGADCTYGEMSAFLHRCLGEPSQCSESVRIGCSGGPHFFPRSGTVATSTEIVFWSFESMCKAIGKNTVMDWEKGLVQVRKPRKMSGTKLMRVIGTYFNGVTGSAPACVIVPGLSPDRFVERTPAAPVPTWYRKDTRWNVIEDCYECPFEVKIFTLASFSDEFLRKRGKSTGCNRWEHEGAAGRLQSSFRIHWEPLVKTPVQPLYDTTSAHTPGTIHVRIPVVYLRGEALCAEAGQLIRKSGIRIGNTGSV